MNEIEFERKFFFLSRKYLEKSFPPFTENVKQNFASLLNPNFTKYSRNNFVVRRKSKLYEIFAKQFRTEAKIQVSRNIRETIFMSTLQHASFLVLNYPLGLASRAGGGGGGRKQNVFPFSVPS